MEIIPMLLKEMEQEAQTTRKILALIPDDKLNWQPHPKSMTIQRLATHIAELPSWVSMGLTTDEINFAANDYKPTQLNSREEILAAFEKALESGRSHLTKATEAELEKPWTMRNGETIYLTCSKVELIRVAYNQTVHHRAQLGVFFRLLDIPLPGSYGPTADNPSM